MRKLIKWFFRLILLFTFLVVLSNVVVVLSTTGQLSIEIEQLEEAEVALVLGTSKSTTEGGENLFFKDRIRAAAELYKAGKVKRIILSGDNLSSKYYNEPKDMLAALEKYGIPKRVVKLDDEGVRTFESVLRCKEEFNENEVIIVTQSFHAYRALYLANHFDINAQAIAANYDSQVYGALILREVFARGLAILDIHF